MTPRNSFELEIWIELIKMRSKVVGIPEDVGKLDHGFASLVM